MANMPKIFFSEEALDKYVEDKRYSSEREKEYIEAKKEYEAKRAKLETEMADTLKDEKRELKLRAEDLDRQEAQNKEDLENARREFEIEKKGQLSKLRIKVDEAHFEEMRELRSENDTLRAKVEGLEMMVEFLQKNKGLTVNSADLAEFLEAVKPNIKNCDCD